MISHLWQVLKLVNVWCHADPLWSLELLQCAAPKLKKLHAIQVTRDHLQVILAMPRLERLTLYDCVLRDSLLLPTPAGSVSAKLQWLRILGLPRSATRCVLRAYRYSLEKLLLKVGTHCGSKELPPRWPHRSLQLHALLEECGLEALKELVLSRAGDGFSHSMEDCREQLNAVRHVLPGVTVRCEECYGVRRQVM